MDFKEETREMIQLMREAAKKEVLPRFGKVTPSSKKDYKEFKEWVTEADVKSSELILRSIRPKFPGSYSEEDLSEDRFDPDILWQVDPVDGTQEFIEQLVDGYAMHAALLQRTGGVYAPVAGVIYLPGVDKLWYNDGGGLHFAVNGGERSVPNVSRDEVIGYVRKVDPNEKVRELYTRLGQELQLPSKVQTRGGSGASFSDLLEGRINLIVMNYDYTKEWDVAMAEPILVARGGFICDLSGNNFTYNRKDPFNRNGYVASIAFRKEEILPHIPEDLLIRNL